MLDDEIVAEIAQSYGQLKERVEDLENKIHYLSDRFDKLSETVKTIIKCVTK